MNKFLNGITQASLAPGRVRMDYKHRFETDSFSNLSPAGFASLPPAIARYAQRTRPPRLRTTRDSRNPNNILGHIIKVNLDNLHIQNPGEPYDCRISINFEVKVPTDVDISDLTEPPSQEKPAQPDRKKDRLSYKHLAYSVDLTKVEQTGAPARYELELEVDAGVLKEQIERGKRGEDSAYTDVVSGFLDNMTFLMRQAP